MSEQAFQHNPSFSRKRESIEARLRDIQTTVFQLATSVALYVRYRSRWIPAFAGMTVQYEVGIKC